MFSLFARLKQLFQRLGNPAVEDDLRPYQQTLVKVNQAGSHRVALDDQALRTGIGPDSRAGPSAGGNGLARGGDDERVVHGLLLEAEHLGEAGARKQPHVEDLLHR
ncbi:MAG TPA: hypothetical protein VKE94_05585 [Gemmataceae bacterium]|nr:hypothetical protein [Gemmataceae bacterium]